MGQDKVEDLQTCPYRVEDANEPARDIQSIFISIGKPISFDKMYVS
jgi:hypothetical protein